MLRRGKGSVKIFKHEAAKPGSALMSPVQGGGKGSCRCNMATPSHPTGPTTPGTHMHALFRNQDAVGPAWYFTFCTFCVVPGVWEHGRIGLRQDLWYTSNSVSPNTTSLCPRFVLPRKMVFSASLCTDISQRDEASRPLILKPSAKYQLLWHVAPVSPDPTQAPPLRTLGAGCNV